MKKREKREKVKEKHCQKEERRRTERLEGLGRGEGSDVSVEEKRKKDKGLKKTLAGIRGREEKNRKG